jgi:hypothetical protein
MKSDEICDYLYEESLVFLDHSCDDAILGFFEEDNAFKIVYSKSLLPDRFKQEEAFAGVLICIDFDEAAVVGASLAVGFDSAIIGYSGKRVVYSKNKMADKLMREDGMKHSEAMEFLEYNTFGVKGKPLGVELPIWCDDTIFDFNFPDIIEGDDD